MSNTPKSQTKKNLHIECVCVWWSYLANAYVNVIVNVYISVYIIMLRTVFHKICEILKHRKCRYEHSCSLGMGIFLHTSIERNKIYINICTTLYCLWSSLALTFSLIVTFSIKTRWIWTIRNDRVLERATHTHFVVVIIFFRLFLSMI